MKQMIIALCIVGMMLLRTNVQADLNNKLGAGFNDGSNDGFNDDLATFNPFKGKELKSLGTGTGSSSSGLSSDFKNKDGSPTNFPEKLIVGKT